MQFFHIIYSIVLFLKILCERAFGDEGTREIFYYYYYYNCTVFTTCLDLLIQYSHVGINPRKKITMFHTRLFKFVSGYVFILLIINNVLGDFLFQFLLTNGVKA